MASLVTVIGDSLLDVRAAPIRPMRPGADVPALVDLNPGGQGSNIAVRLARRGVRTRLVCRLAPDAPGVLLREALVADRVEVIDLGATRSGTVVVILDADGDRTMLSQRVPLLEAGLDITLVSETDWLVVSGYVLLEPDAGISGSGEAPRRAIAGCSLHPSQADAWAASAASFQPHLIVLNDGEAQVLAAVDGQPSDLSRHLGDRLGAVVVVTHATGAVAVAGDQVVHAVPPPRRPAVDTTGAGDAFTAALVAELLDSPWPPSPDTLRAALGVASELAAAVTLVDGAQARVSGEGRIG